MAYVRLDQNGVIIQKQPYAQAGFVEAPDTVIAGQIRQSNGTYINPDVIPLPESEEDDVMDTIKLRDRVTHQPVEFEVRNGNFNQMTEQDDTG